MGVPGFFAWLLRNHKQHKFMTNKLPSKPKILYLDANCLFHPQCFKILEYFPNLFDVNKLEKYMFKRILNYIDFLIAYVDPEILYLAVDGVAPLAKIAQQRKRRFKTIDDNLSRELIKKKYNVEFNNTWSNIKITPGTVFMEKLHNKINNYLKKKTNIKCVYSSYHIPGEGEHKILQDIKERNKNLINNDLYVIYGLDADLIFLSMVSKKNNIYLLRESSQIDNNKSNNIKSIDFDPIKNVSEELKYVSIDSTIECYNEQVISIIKKKQISKDLNVDLNNKSFINDFVFLCYLLGNDFLPHIPSIDIKKNGLDFLLDCYADIYIKSGVNIINFVKDSVKINYVVLLEILKICSIKEPYYFSKILPEHIEKNNKKKCYDNSDDYKREIWELENLRNIKITDDIMLGKGKSDEWKTRYYKHYFEKYDKETIEKICHNYFEGLEWVTKYYFENCHSWLWQYKYTHAPFVSDLYFFLKNNNFTDIKFTHDIPLNPCEQLLSVLHPSCHNELPKKYQKLVIDKDSPIKDMFPDVFDSDCLYKEQLWQCIPLIPFLDVDRIKKECSKIKLLKNEQILNEIHKDVILY